ncbi:hypothetical protein CYLTODRAFT_280966 [Cylindrobasidium torrendii FP15055 ss-10]|uniref:Uncharacterized protein n=1 Tax=Cylindrobasidium torrendii FP15055 ss-10 TaxID=1314674 RepID=A0A0D7BB91_9AGAR|nr:hypothetical protein CYLTODRAFT_280966 [Cylindrobasidium torrendii FP15055 ss-10]
MGAEADIALEFCLQSALKLRLARKKGPSRGRVSGSRGRIELSEGHPNGQILFSQEGTTIQRRRMRRIPRITSLERGCHLAGTGRSQALWRDVARRSPCFPRRVRRYLQSDR